MKRNRIRWCAMFALVLSAFLSEASGQSYFQQNPGQPIWGKALSDKDLAGKVVYIEYWGINCGPCRAVFPQLVEAQAFFAKTGRFVLVGSHLQNLSPEVQTFLQAQQCNFTNYQQYICPLAPPEGGGIPQAYLLDHKGQLMASGHPQEVIPKIAPLVEIAMKASPAGFAFNPGGNVDWPADMAKIQAAFASGKAWVGPIKQLEKRSKSKKGAEDAQRILENIQSSITVEVARVAEMKDTKPVEAFQRLTLLKKNLAGLPEAEEVEELLKSFDELEGLDEARKAMAMVQSFQKKQQAGKLNQTAVTKEVKKIVRALQEVADSSDFSDSIKAEAQEMIDFLNDQYGSENG